MTESGHEPQDIRATHQKVVEWLHEHDADHRGFVELFTPRARMYMLDVLLQADEPLTAKEICDRADIDRSTFDAHLDYLLTTGVVIRPKKKGNAWVFELNDRHPVAQLLLMADVVFRHGQTPMLLEEQFLGEPGADYQAGDHPEDPR